MPGNLFKYGLKRFLGLFPTLFIILTAAFFMMRLAPGGPFDRERSLPKEVEENLERLYGLDRPICQQYASYIAAALRGDFGRSFSYPDKTVREIILRTFPVSLKLGLVSFFFAVLAGISLGVASAMRKGKWIDWLFFSFSVFGVSVPSIVLAPVLILVFGVWLKLLPVAGWGSFKEMVLPALTLSVIFISFIGRITRASVIETLEKDYVKTARALGIGTTKLLYKYVLKGSLLPVVSYSGPALAGVITGSLVIEKIFFIPGLGSHFVVSALNRDYTLAMGTVIFYSAILLLANLAADILYMLLDPRVTYD